MGRGGEPGCKLAFPLVERPAVFEPLPPPRPQRPQRSSPSAETHSRSGLGDDDGVTPRVCVAYANGLAGFMSERATGTAFFRSCCVGNVGRMGHGAASTGS